MIAIDLKQPRPDRPTASRAAQMMRAKFSGAKALNIAIPSSLSAQAQLDNVSAPSELVHFLDRTSYGYTEQELDQINAIGFDAYLEQQLNPENLDNTLLEGFLVDALPTLDWDYQQLLDYARLPPEEQRRTPRNPAFELVLATLVRQWLSPRQLEETMVEFWTNHFNVFLFDGAVQYLKTVDDRENIRPHALGKFGDLLRANARSPAMLFYLDNYSNTVDGPNENYARELLELHTLGVDGGYTEFDVKEVAKAFTGWTLSEEVDGLFTFVPQFHDDGELRVLGTAIAAGSGIEAGEIVLDMLAAHPSTANFVCFKLARRFVADDPPQALVDSMARTFMATDGDIRAILTTLFTSPEFADSQGQKFKRPTEFAISLLRRLQPETSDRFIGQLFDQLNSLGQLPFYAIDPTGYADAEADWLNTSSLLSRWNFGFALAFNAELTPSIQKPTRFGRAIFPRYNDIGTELDLRPLLGDARTPLAIVDQLVERVLHQTIDAADHQALVEYGAPGEAPAEPLDGEALLSTARRVLAAIINSHYFQRR